MLKMSSDGRSLTRLAASTLAQASILERNDLQKAILRSWADFRSELGYGELYLIGDEIEPHSACQDRIDILALDGDNHPVIIELKRGRDRLQLLQAISYAGMVARWDAQAFLKALPPVSSDEEQDVLREALRAEDFEPRSPKIILLAEAFDPEVILAADWLADFGVDITALAISVTQHPGETLISIDQRFPLLGLDEVYERRGRRSKSSASDDAAWEARLSQYRFSFARKAFEQFRTAKPGDAARGRFTSMFSGSPFGGMTINFRRDYLTIYTSDQSPELEAKLKAALGPDVEVEPWGSPDQTQNYGYTFQLRTEAQFDRFLRAVGKAAPTAVVAAKS